MKKYRLILILILIFSVNAVYSQDTNDTNNFIDLNNEISQNDMLNITSDYSFDSKIDANYTNGIVINKNIIINGNNHIIDGNGMARIFTINSSNVILNNLIVKNAKNYAIFSSNSTITATNITFLNNTGNNEGGAVHIDNTTLTCENNKFIDNYGTRFGNAIYATSNSTLNLKNNNFESNKELYWGLIFISESKLIIVDSNFEKIISKYTPVLYAENMQNMLIRNSRFKNLHASVTAGALGLKENKNTIRIDNCTFENVSSEKNGGAIYIDVNGASIPENTFVFINNLKFINCSSSFGGAYVQLGGNLTMTNSIFTDNSAFNDGGAVYLSDVKANMQNILFKDNSINESNYGGALFFDHGTLSMTNTNFTGNNNALYLFDSNYTISNSQFKDNGYNIYSIFDGINAKTTNCQFIGGKNKINQTDYVYTFMANNAPIDYNPVIFDLSLVNSSYFDLRKEGLVSSVKNQGWSGTCWAFSTAAVLESALLKATNRTLNLDISENNIRNVALKYNRFGSGSEEGGDAEQGGAYLINWFGGVLEEYDTYDELGKISQAFNDVNKYYVFRDILLRPRFNTTDNYRIKEALVKYGALGVAVLAPDSNNDDYNNKTSAAYSNMSKGTDHAVTLVGWDDNYSASNFKITPPGDGAWIIKNSWGEDWGDKGYYYASYYDESVINYDTRIFAIIIDQPISYEKLYQYDTNGRISYFHKFSGKIPIDSNYTQWELYNLRKNLTLPCNYSNTFEANGNDIISAVGTYFVYDDFNYTIWIYINGKEVYSQSGIPSYSGYNIINLNKEIPVKKGENFTILIQSSSTPAVFENRNKIKSNVSYSNYGGSWKNMALDENIASIKVYTNPNNMKINASNLTKYFSGNQRFIVNVYDSFNNSVSNQSVNISVNGVTYTKVTDSNGSASLAVNFNPGVYDVASSIDGIAVYSTITVLSTIDGNDLVKVFRNSSQYWATFLDGEGNYLSNGTSVQFNIHGVMYERKVSGDKGLARLNINLEAGEYVITAMNPVTGDMASNNITVLSKITENVDLVKYYRNTSQYSVKIIGGDGKAVGAGESVTFNINGVLYTRQTDANGTAKLNINLQSGDYIITAEYKGCLVSNSIKVLPVLTASDITMKYRDGTQFKASLVDGQGKAYAEQTLQFNIKGVLYNRVTGSDGIAKLNINLIPGEYIITSSYNGSSIANKITIRG